MDRADRRSVAGCFAASLDDFRSELAHIAFDQGCRRRPWHGRRGGADVSPRLRHIDEKVLIFLVFGLGGPSGQ